jgi:hypothetical protein
MYGIGRWLSSEPAGQLSAGVPREQLLEIITSTVQTEGATYSNIEVSGLTVM